MKPKLHRLYVAFSLCLLLLSASGVAQVWVPITHASGSQVINGRTVTVTSAGSVRTEGTFRHCGATPYTIGINYNGIPGSYTYAFSPATTTVRFLMSATNIGEINSFYINGAHYPLTPANILPLNTCDTQFQLPLSIQAGNAIFAGPTIPGQSWFGQFGSGIVQITFPAGIDSIRVNSNGVMGGTTYGFAYWGFYAIANNNNPCQGSPLLLTGGPTEPGVSYFWTGPNGFSSTDQNPVIPNADMTHQGIYTLRTIFNVDTAYDTTLVQVREVPATPVITGDSIVCVGTTAYLSSASTTPGVDYLWDGPNGYRSTNANTSIRNVRDRDTGLYSVVAILNGCPSTPATMRLIVQYPVAGDTIPAEICPGGAYDFYGRQLTTPGIYEHILPASAGCDSATYLNLSFSVPPQDTIPASMCFGGSYDFNGSILTEAGYYADTVSTAAGCDSIIILHLAVNPALRDTFAVSICEGASYAFGGAELTTSGSYQDTLKTPDGCDSIRVLNLTVHPLPHVRATYDHPYTPCLGDTIMLLGDGATDYTWYLSGREIGRGASFPFVISNEYNEILVQGTDNQHCKDSATMTLSADPCCGLFIPNAFTPNGDGRNDHFRVRVEGRLSRFRIDILNRWGQSVYIGTDINQYWDGTVNGIPADIGTYFYQITGKCLSGTEIYEKGDITLIR